MNLRDLETWPDYLARISNGAAQVSIARAAGVDAGTISRWKTGRGHPSPESVIELCRHFERSPIEGLIAAGYLLASECDRVVEVVRPITARSNEEILAEISRRFEEKSR
ncbi:helix-turn-helix domain-containing protein [Nakamurella panacisegetis]|uniref:helix-turn-helix domain-containing protein n=1 Tax=Nakamurella panacisegetis TaxID=1090615 RepID=UPI0012FDDC84|nr:helix-turn-helix transcriptional regulator [Nakamurella panacisegetis]